MCTHNLCFEQKSEESHNFSSENDHFYSREKLQYITRACLRNEMTGNRKQKYDIKHLLQIITALERSITSYYDWKIVALR